MDPINTEYLFPQRQKIFFISAIVILALIALIEGVVLLRNAPRRSDGTASVSQILSARTGPLKNHRPQTDNARRGKEAGTEKEDIILQETAEDLERMQNQINRLFYEMTGDPPFTRQNISRPDWHDRSIPFHPPDNIQRLQTEIAQIFRRAHESRHSGALNLIEQDWRDVGPTSSVNIEGNSTNYIVTVSMPGFERTNINVNISGRILAVEADAEKQAFANGARSDSANRFKTQIMLPNDISGESALAVYRDGVLQVTVPRKPTSNSLARKVTIM